MSDCSEKHLLTRRLLEAGKETALTALALAGGLCVIAAIAGALLHIDLVVFRTGSMAPGIQPGAVAVVREVPAVSLMPGDIATVQREGSALPVTHRVVAAEPDPADGHKALLTLKGDANSSADPVRYNVATAKKLVFSVPAVGSWIMRLQNPWFMGFCSLAVASLITWTFWPKGKSRRATGTRQPTRTGRTAERAGAR